MNHALCAALSGLQLSEVIAGIIPTTYSSLILVDLPVKGDEPHLASYGESYRVHVRFAFKTSPQDTIWNSILEVWRAADHIELFESGWTSDHFHAMHGADPSCPRLEGWMTLAALAQATRRLRLGTLVTGVHYRHPAVLANMAATLDVISGGRLEIGIGAGWNETAHARRPSATRRSAVRLVVIDASFGTGELPRLGLSRFARALLSAVGRL